MVPHHCVHWGAYTVSESGRPGGATVLFNVTFRTQAHIDAMASEEQDLLEWCSEVSVEPGIDYGIQETV